MKNREEERLKDLKDLRLEIDKIDDELIELFVKRMDISLEVANYKKANNLPVLNPEREREILNKVSSMVSQKQDAEMDNYARVFFSTLLNVSRSRQDLALRGESPIIKRAHDAIQSTPTLFPEKATVACQGLEGAYSGLASEKLFKLPTIMYFNTFENVFAAVEKGLCQYGILPIENSSAGSVGEVYDLMKNYNFSIAKSVKLHIKHALLVNPETKLSDIKEIYSHEQALNQCGNFLKDLKNVNIKVCENTAEAAKKVKELGSSNVAAISSKSCAALYGLDILNDDIQNSDNNYTRFICISKNLEIYPGANKISIMLSVPHRPLALYHIISKFAALGLNMSKLESRPISGSDFDFMFYFDIDGSLQSELVLSLMSQLEKELDFFVFLGNYPED